MLCNKFLCFSALEDPIRRGRAFYACKECGRDVSMCLHFMFKSDGDDMEKLDSWVTNRRALVKLGNTVTVVEVFIMGISSNRRYVKLMYMNGHQQWISADDVTIIDFLAGGQFVGGSD